MITQFNSIITPIYFDLYNDKYTIETFKKKSMVYLVYS